MNEKKYTDLIHREIDGLNAPEESNKLKEFLKTNSAAQQLFSDLAALSDMLHDVPKVEAPRDLKRNVMHALRAREYGTKDTKGVLRPVLGRFISQINFKYAYAFSFGLIAGIIIYSLCSDAIKSTPFDVSNLHGTIISKTVPEGFELADRINLDFEQVHGETKIFFAQGILLLKLEIESQQEIKIAFEFDEHDLSMNGIIQSRSENSNLNTGIDYVTVTSVGDNTYILVFNDKTQTSTHLNFRMYASGALLFDRIITTDSQNKR